VLDENALYGVLDEQGLLDGYVHTLASRSLADFEVASPDDPTPRNALDALSAYIEVPTRANAYTAHLAAYSVAPSVGRSDVRRRRTNNVIDTAIWCAAEAAQRAALVPYADKRPWAAIMAAEDSAAAVMYFTEAALASELAPDEAEHMAEEAHRTESDWQLRYAIGLAYPALDGAPASIALSLAAEFDWTFPDLITITHSICLEHPLVE
jgi:hypothetical protein